MKKFRYGLLAIFLAFLFFSFLTSLSSETGMERELVSLSCDNNTFKIIGEAQNMTTGWAMHDYKFNLALYLNDKLIQRNNEIPLPIEYLIDEENFQTFYFGTEPSPNSASDIKKLLSTNLAIFVPSTDFSDSEYNSLVKCIESNLDYVRSSLNEVGHKVKPSIFSTKTYYVRPRFGDILMISYGEPTVLYGI